MKAASTSTDLTDLIKSADDTQVEKKATVKWTTARYKKVGHELVTISGLLTQAAQKPAGTFYYTPEAIRQYRDTINTLQVLIAVAGKKPSTKGKVIQ